MKNRICLLIVLAGFFFTGCQISENINMNDDGSGKLSFDVDASGLMEMAGDKMKENGKAKDMDSTFTFKQLLSAKKDSIAKLPAEEQARLKKMENVSVNMKMNTAKKQFLISMFLDFKKTDELVDMMQGMSSLKGGKETAPGPMKGIAGGNTDLKYSFDGNTFKRNVRVKDKTVQAAEKDSTGAMKALFGTSMYTLKYHFPRKVKSVSNKDAMFSEDRKTVTVQYPFAQYMDDPESMNLEVVLEKK